MQEGSSLHRQGHFVSSTRHSVTPLNHIVDWLKKSVGWYNTINQLGLLSKEKTNLWLRELALLSQGVGRLFEDRKSSLPTSRTTIEGSEHSKEKIQTITFHIKWLLTSFSEEPRMESPIGREKLIVIDWRALQLEPSTEWRRTSLSVLDQQTERE